MHFYTVRDNAYVYLLGKANYNNKLELSSIGIYFRDDTIFMLNIVV